MRGQDAVPLRLNEVVAGGLMMASATAGALHLAAAADHRGLPLYVAFFVVAGMTQLLWAGLLQNHTTTLVLGAGAAGQAALIGVWAVSRTIGIGVVPGAGTPEPIGFHDAVVVFLELIVVAGCGLLVVIPAAARELRVSAGRMALGALASGVAVMAAAAMGLGSADGHEHAAGGQDQGAADQHHGGGHLAAVASRTDEENHGHGQWDAPPNIPPREGHRHGTDGARPEPTHGHLPLGWHHRSAATGEVAGTPGSTHRHPPSTRTRAVGDVDHDRHLPTPDSGSGRNHHDGDPSPGPAEDHDHEGHALTALIEHVAATVGLHPR